VGGFVSLTQGHATTPSPLGEKTEWFIRLGSRIGLLGLSQTEIPLL
jgi:hypothetical protein